MEFAQLETVYEHLAVALDRAGPEHRELLLARLVLLLAEARQDSVPVLAAIDAALAGLPLQQACHGAELP